MLVHVRGQWCVCDGRVRLLGHLCPCPYMMLVDLLDQVVQLELGSSRHD